MLINAPLPPTSQATLGPFVPRTYFQPGDNDLTRIATDAAPTTKGETILLRGQVRREGGVPCLNMILEAWQADAQGRFDHPLDPAQQRADPDFLGWGRAFTDAEGRYEFRTVMPGGFHDSTGARAPHVNLIVMGAGLMRLSMTTAFFPDHAAQHAADPVLALVDPARRKLLIATEEARDEGLRVFRFDLLLRGDAATETPFFEV